MRTPAPFEQQKELRKAQQMVDHLWSRGYRAQDLTRMHIAVLEHHSKTAGVHFTSPQSWEMVAGLMQVREREEMTEDPFAGL